MAEKTVCPYSDYGGRNRRVKWYKLLRLIAVLGKSSLAGRRKGLKVSLDYLIDKTILTIGYSYYYSRKI